MKATFMQRMVWLAILELLREAYKFSLDSNLVAVHNAIRSQKASFSRPYELGIPPSSTHVKMSDAFMGSHPRPIWVSILLHYYSWSSSTEASFRILSVTMYICLRMALSGEFMALGIDCPY